jgi:hypothetical protein
MSVQAAASSEINNRRLIKQCPKNRLFNRRHATSARNALHAAAAVVCAMYIWSCLAVTLPYGSVS